MKTTVFLVSFAFSPHVLRFDITQVKCQYSKGILSDSLSFSVSQYFAGLFFTSPQNCWGVIFSLQFVCVSVYACEQYASRMDEPVWTRFSLNSCLLHWLGYYWNWWPKVKVTVTQYPFFLHNSLLSFQL